MVKWLRNECHGNHYLTGHIYSNSNRFKWLYSNRYDKCYTKHYPVKCKYYWFNKPDLYNHKRNQNC